MDRIKAHRRLSKGVEAFAPRYRAEIDKFAKLVKDAGIPLVD